jgi:hypothetical protein
MAGSIKSHVIRADGFQSLFILGETSGEFSVTIGRKQFVQAKAMSLTIAPQCGQGRVFGGGQAVPGCREACAP